MSGPAGRSGGGSYLRGYLACGFRTTLNVVLYAATLGRFVLLEGRVRGGVFSNWAGRFRYRPARVARPRTEEELVEVVRSSRRVRVFGSGHSFNEGVVSEETLVSLDDYSGLVWRDPQKKRIAVRGGTRVREVIRLLAREGLAFEALPSHDAQSIGGILSTDVHGTGRDWGFVSESVVGLKLVNGLGEVHECGPADDLFRAAVGGLGAVGIISEVVVQAVDRFDVHQRVETMSLRRVRANLGQMLEENRHLSLYLFPFAEDCRVNTWNPTRRRGRSPLGDLRESLRISWDALMAAWAGGFMAYTRLLPRLSRPIYGMEYGSDLVLESDRAFNRSVYHLHRELEFTVPFEDAFDACDAFLRLYEREYRRGGLPYTLLEVRFTPARDLSLIGAGRGRRSAWIDLVSNDSPGFERYYAAAEDLVRRMRARPHLGKHCESFVRTDLARLHGESFARFEALVARHDPDGRFENGLTRRLFGGGA